MGFIPTRVRENGGMPEHYESVTEERVRVRRSPRFARFIVVCCVVLVAVAFVITYSMPQGAGYDRNTVFGFVALVAIAVGIALGSVIALIFDRISRARAKVLLADRVQVEGEDAPGLVIDDDSVIERGAEDDGTAPENPR